MSIFAQFGVEPIINAAGPLTRLGGAPMPDAVVEAMRQATRDAVPIEALQAAAARVIARSTGTESALVTSGASAALTLGAAAILAGNDLARIDRLPDTSSMPNEFLVARDQRNGYDHALRAAGARLVDVGMNEVVAGSGVRPVEVADYMIARSERTAGILFVERPGIQPRLADVVAWAQAASLPVLVDAAAELPPASNLRSIPGTGADLVCFSGGKAIRGPQATGILCGKQRFIESAALQMLDMDEVIDLWDPPKDFIDRSRWPALPRQGIGRGFKVGKEQIVGLLVALELFVHDSPDPKRSTPRRVERLRAELQRAGIETIQEHAGGLDFLIPLEKRGADVARRLRQGKPSVYVRLESAGLRIHLGCVREDQEGALLEALLRELKASLVD